MESIFELLLEFIFSSLFEWVITGLLAAVGATYLLARYRNLFRVRRALRQQYANSYANAGRVVTLNIVAGVGVLLMVGLLLAVVRQVVLAILN